VNHRPVESTDAFREMTVDDAKWMARLIGQLTERQIGDALRAAGWNRDEGLPYAQKLIQRRNRMIEDLNLQREIAPLAVPLQE
jgi:hypothetical protein